MEKKYKIIVLNKDGSPKTTMQNYIEEHYSNIVLLDPQKLPQKGNVLKVRYYDLPDYLTTAKIENISCSVNGNFIVVVTEKSIYTFNRLRPTDLKLIRRLHHFCEEHNYFTGGSNDQYDKFFELAKQNAPADVLASIVYICSPDLKSEAIESITEEIEGLLYD